MSAWNLSARRRREMPEGLWMRCSDCESLIYRKEWEESLKVCPKCGYHFRIGSRERIQYSLDENSFDEHYVDLAPSDPLQFVDRVPYSQRLERYQKATGLKDAAVVGKGTINGTELWFGVIDFSFLAGSMGSVVGEKLTRIFENALAERKPIVVVSAAGGGARMMEGAISLFQMSKTSCAVQRLHEAGVPFISVLTDPTMGGVMASYASQGDVLISEPRALIGFTGPRVIRETIKEELPPGFQKAEFALEHGLIDMIVHRRDMKATLADLIAYLTANNTSRA